MAAWKNITMLFIHVHANSKGYLTAQNDSHIITIREIQMKTKPKFPRAKVQHWKVLQ